MFYSTIEMYRKHVFRAGFFPRIAIAQPIISFFHLKQGKMTYFFGQWLMNKSFLVAEWKWGYPPQRCSLNTALQSFWCQIMIFLIFPVSLILNIYLCFNCHNQCNGKYMAMKNKIYWAIVDFEKVYHKPNLIAYNSNST